MGDNYGIFLNNFLSKGVTYPTQTFDSPCLTLENDFNVSNLEVWGFDSDLEASYILN